MSSLLLLYIRQTIYRIKSLVPEWPCIIEVSYIYPPTTGNRDVEKSRSHAPRYDTYVPLWTNIQDGPRIFRPCCWLRSGFVLSVLLLSFTPATVFAIAPRIAPRFRIFSRKIRQVLTSLISPFALFRACCVVVESHSSHSLAIFSVNSSSFS